MYCSVPTISLRPVSASVTVRPDVVKPADIGMVQGGNRARFAFEAFRESLGCDLDRDGSVEPGVAGLIYLAHPARANQGMTSYGPKVVPGARSMSV